MIPHLYFVLVLCVYIVFTLYFWWPTVQDAAAAAL